MSTLVSVFGDGEQAIGNIIGKDIFMRDPIGHICTHCGESYDAWKPGDLNEIHAISDEGPVKFRAVCESNDRSELVFRLISPGQYFNYLLHWKRGATN